MAYSAGKYKVVDLEFDRPQGSDPIRSSDVKSVYEIDVSPTGRLIKALITGATIAGTDLAVTGALAYADYRLTRLGLRNLFSSPIGFAHQGAGLAETAVGAFWGLKLLVSVAIDLATDASTAAMTLTNTAGKIQNATNEQAFSIALKAAVKKNVKFAQLKIPGVKRVKSAFGYRS